MFLDPGGTLEMIDGKAASVLSYLLVYKLRGVMNPVLSSSSDSWMCISQRYRYQTRHSTRNAYIPVD